MKWQCALLQRWLPEYPDGDLPGFWRRRLRVHLDHCPTCREELAALKEVVEAIQAAPVADPGPEFWSEFSREMHLKLVQAAHAGEMAPAPRSAWWGRLPYLVGGPALAVLCLWVAVSYYNPERPVLAPASPVAQSVAPEPAPAPRMAREEKSAGPAEKMATALPAAPLPGETQNFVYVARNGGGDEAPLDDESDDLDSTLAGMTPQEKEAFLKKLSQHEKDGSCITRFSAIA